MWDLTNPAAEPLVLRGHEGAIRALGFAPDGRLVTAGLDNTVRVWDLRNPGAEPLVLRGHEGGIVALGFAPDGRLVTASDDKRRGCGTSAYLGSSARRRSSPDGT